MTDNRVEREAKEILEGYIQRNLKGNPDKGKFIVKHSLRVEACCMEIADAYETLTDIDIFTLQASAIFHDIGNVVQREEHGAIGGKIVESLFDSTKYISDFGVDRKRLANIISRHSEKDNMNDNDIVSIILKDADVLDQIGAMSILMHSSKYDYNSIDFYQNILNDINLKEFKFIEEQRMFLRTDAARRILDRKTQFIRSFSKELEYEINGEICSF